MRILLSLLFFHTLLLTAAPRVVSLSPAVTDAIVAIGGRSLLCGRSDVCNAPETASLPIAGSMGLPRAEAIIRLRPTLVISDTRHPGGQWKLLEKFRIRTIFLPTSDIDNYPDNLRKLGELLGLTANAEKVAARFETEIAELRHNCNADGKKVLVILGIPPVISCGKKSFINEAVKLAGLKNICGENDGSYFRVSPEFIIREQPEIIIISGVPENAVYTFFKREEFRTLPAVKKQNFISIDPDRFCRAGASLPQAIRHLKQTTKSL